jgi:glycosyltransferase involved in cell wall biosynthesis
MKVLHVISDENIGGAGVLLTTLLKNFDPMRVESVVALPEGSALCDRIRRLGVPICELRYPCDRFSRASVRELCGVIREESADIVHANAALCARIAARRCGVAVLHTRHCCFPPTGIWRLGAVRRIGGVCNRALSDHVIATADAAAKDLYQLGIPQDRVEVILNGSEPVRELSEDELTEARGRWGISTDDFTVGICARLEPCKGHETFLRAAKLLIETHPQIPFRFLIVGQGSRRSVLEEMTEALGISQYVVFCGFVEDMAEIYRILRVNVNCSCGTETSCLALSEGMSAGVPAIASDYGGNPRMITPGENGYLFPPHDDEALASTLLCLLSDRAQRERLSQGAFRLYHEKFTAPAMVRQIEDLYLRLMREKGKRDTPITADAH